MNARQMNGFEMDFNAGTRFGVKGFSRNYGNHGKLVLVADDRNAANALFSKFYGDFIAPAGWESTGTPAYPIDSQVFGETEGSAAFASNIRTVALDLGSITVDGAIMVTVNGVVESMRIFTHEGEKQRVTVFLGGQKEISSEALSDRNLLEGFLKSVRDRIVGDY